MAIVGVCFSEKPCHPGVRPFPMAGIGKRLTRDEIGKFLLNLPTTKTFLLVPGTRKLAYPSGTENAFDLTFWA